MRVSESVIFLLGLVYAVGFTTGNPISPPSNSTHPDLPPCQPDQSTNKTEKNTTEDDTPKCHPRSKNSLAGCLVVIAGSVGIPTLLKLILNSIHKYMKRRAEAEIRTQRGLDGIKIRAWTLESEAADCPVCFEPFLRQATWPRHLVATLGCGHTFHVHCLMKWVQNGGRSCPACRKELMDWVQRDMHDVAKRALEDLTAERERRKKRAKEQKESTSNKAEDKGGEGGDKVENVKV